MKKHTPGPWLQSSTMLVCNEEARIIANCTPMVDVPELSIPFDQVDANARLIAAAPDLLAALAFYVAICGNTAHSITREGAQEACDRATDAIKKAKGEG